MTSYLWATKEHVQSTLALFDRAKDDRLVKDGGDDRIQTMGLNVNKDRQLFVIEAYSDAKR
jgi:uncharacterized protein YjhX (UPF0386 family)